MNEPSNADQIEYWNDNAGPRWAEAAEAMDLRIRPFGDAALNALEAQTGERVLDVGCGCGDTTLTLAQAVGTPGQVVGVDISEPMLARARQRAQDQPQVSFERQDAQVWDGGQTPFDAVFSRFGVMFFEQPIVAFTNLRSFVREGGRLAFVCWQERERNPWMTDPIRTVADMIELPEPPGPRDPGPFAFGDQSYVETMLNESGWKDVGFQAVNRNIVVGESAEEATQFFTEIGPLTGPISELNPAQAQAVREKLTGALTDQFGGAYVALPASVWIVTARVT